MSDDTSGFDISEVLQPVSAKTFLAPESESLWTRENIINPNFTPTSPAVQLPLYTEDGGPEWTNEDDGDAITFFQEGYQIPSGLFNTTLTITYAGIDDTLRALQGESVDADGYGIVRGGSGSAKWRIFHQGLYKAPGIDGLVVWNRAGTATATVTESQESRGEVKAYEVVFSFTADLETLSGGVFHQAILYPTEESV